MKTTDRSKPRTEADAKAQTPGIETTIPPAAGEPQRPVAATAVLYPDSDEALYGDDDLDDEPSLPAAKPEPTPWTVIDPRGRGRDIDVHWSANWCHLSLTFARHGLKYGEYDRGAAEQKQRATDHARQSSEVRHWFAAIAEQAGHRKRARVARAEAEALSARRRLLAETGTDDLARQLRDLDAKVRDAQAAASDAEDLARQMVAVVNARRAAARQSIAESYGVAVCGGSLAADRRTKELLAQLIERAGPILDELAQVATSRQTLGAVAGMDRGPQADMILRELEAEAELPKARVAPESQPAA